MLIATNLTMEQTCLFAIFLQPPASHLPCARSVKLVTSYLGNQLGQPILILPNQAQIFKIKLVWLVDFAVSSMDWGSHYCFSLETSHFSVETLVLI